MNAAHVTHMSPSPQLASVCRIELRSSLFGLKIYFLRGNVLLGLAQLELRSDLILVPSPLWTRSEVDQRPPQGRHSFPVPGHARILTKDDGHCL